MRKILFRGKRLDNGEWVEGFFVNQFGCYEIYGLDDADFERIHIDPDTVGQFTGLTDKNGEKIFEGDIVRVLLSGEPEPIGVIEYGTTGILGFCVKTEKGFSNYLLEYGEDFEIIGNVTDNPELLGGE